MKKLICTLALAAVLVSCKTTQNNTSTINDINVAIDLVNVTNDKVLVTIMPPKFTTETIIFHIPKTVPGTYSTDNYGKYIENIKAYDTKGNELTVTKKDDNSWTISDAKKLNKV